MEDIRHALMHMHMHMRMHKHGYYMLSSDTTSTCYMHMRGPSARHRWQV